MIVVADTSPLNYLILLGHVDVLQFLYSRIFITPAVHEEMRRTKTPASVRAWTENLPHWVELVTPSATNLPINPALDLGEAEAIALARELHADWLLIDEAAGRREAQALGIRVIGTLGILQQAHRLRLLNLHEEVVRLRRLGFRISESIVRFLLDSVD